jgi:hypothetical protein
MMNANKIHLMDGFIFGSSFIEVGMEIPQGTIKEITFNKDVVFITFFDDTGMDIRSDNYVRAIEHNGY